MKPYPYQAEGIEWLTPKRRAILADEMGLGKTVQAIRAAEAKGCQKVLVVCPAFLRFTWSDEIKKWQTNGLPVWLFTGRLIDRMPFEIGLGWYVVSYSLVGQPGVWDQFMSQEWDAVICDEAHYLKTVEADNPNHRTFKVLGYRGPEGAQPGLIQRAEHRMFLSGTPILNRPIEIHSLLASCGFRMGRKDFGARYCGGHYKSPANGIPGHWWDYGATRLPELAKAIRPFVKRRTKAIVLDQLPPVLRRIIYLGNGSMTREQQAFVEYLESGRKTDIDLDTIFRDRGKQAEAFAPQVMHYVTDTLPLVGQMVLFCHHHAMMDALETMLMAAGIPTVVFHGNKSDTAKEAAVQCFQCGVAKVFIGGIRSAGMGITLTSANHVAFAEQDYSPGAMQQCWDRVHRVTQTKQVTCDFLVERGSINDALMNMWVRKESTLSTIWDQFHNDHNAKANWPSFAGSG